MKEDSIDRYLRGENISTANEDFSQSELEELTILREGIRLSALQEKSLMLKELEKEIASNDAPVSLNQSKGRIMNLNQVMAIAASLTLLIAAGLWVVNNSGDSPDDLYASYYTKVPGISESIRSTDPTQQSTYDKAIADYNTQDYDDALNGLNAVNEPEALFYKGIIQMELRNYDSAIESLREYIKVSGVNGDYPAHYYIGLCYLKLDEIDNSKASLREVKQSNTEYYSKAQDLLDKL